ncbi:MAG: hypothetical protein JO323_06995 [Acidobacteriia bacterium]|nr:hypothetical protein [Terriglobia bacterium]
MELKMDKAGRIVLPKPLRDRMGFRPETGLEAIERPEGILLKKTEQIPSMVKVDTLWVHVGVPEKGVDWDAVVESGREERINTVVRA